MKKLILKYAPPFVQSGAISVYNAHLWRQRRAGQYWSQRLLYDEYCRWDIGRLKEEQSRRLSNFLRVATKNSLWYSRYDLRSTLADFPVLEKEDLVANLKKIATLAESEGVVSYTGGTTGASLKVIYTKADMRERFAALDWFRSLYGWELGSRTAWFSGKTLVRRQDLKKGICYRDDWINRIRFFSTFHINDDNFDSYWKAFKEFNPRYVVGFPSSVFDLCQMAEDRGLSFDRTIVAFFPTAETVLPLHRDVIGRVLGCKLYDQYASSEGAPFIFECPRGKKHMHLLTGVFEIVDEDLNPSDAGELLVTSFTTYGTPLIRYRIGDRLEMAPLGERCPCGWSFPIVEHIEGRTTDFVWSRQNGRINLGNLSNSTKGVQGILGFQVRQEAPDEIDISIKGGSGFDETQCSLFIQNVRERTGNGMAIRVHRVNELARDRSGKFRIVVNTLKRSQMR